MNTVIKLEVDTLNPFVLSQLLDNDIFVSLIIKGNDQYLINNDDVLNLNYSRWIIKCLLNANIQTAAEITFYKKKITEICQNLNFIIINIESFVDNTNYPLNGEDDNNFIITDKFCIINDISIFNNYNYQNDKYPLYVNSSQGFGNGRHETTALCISLLEELSCQQHFNPNKILDLGTGSGILAMICAILYKNATIVASDIDYISLQTAYNFLKINKLASKVILQQSDGFNNLNASSYNLVVANILLNPLLKMVKSFSQYIEKDGYLIVSGFYKKQLANLQTALSANNFNLIKTIEKNQWAAALFYKQ